MPIMPRCILFCALLASAPAFAQDTDPAPPAAAAAAPAAPEMTPEQKVTQYRHDQINLLALRAEPESLLAAALFAEPDADDKARPAALKTPALLKRAQTLGADSALIWWASAAIECHANEKECPQAATLQKLEALDAENSAVWLLSLHRAQLAGDAPAARAALTSAAQAKKFDDRFGQLMSALYQAQEVLPMSPELLNATHEDANVSGYRLLTAANLAISRAMPPAGHALAGACKPGDSPPDDVVADCIAIARKLESSGSLFAQSAGLTLHDALLPAGPERDGLQLRQRRLAWQMQRMGELSPQLATDSRVTRTYTQALAGGDEASALAAVLRAEGVPNEPPADWKAPAAAAQTHP
jgi:hypothetical protein